MEYFLNILLAREAQLYKVFAEIVKIRFETFSKVLFNEKIFKFSKISEILLSEVIILLRGYSL